MASVTDCMIGDTLATTEKESTTNSCCQNVQSDLHEELDSMEGDILVWSGGWREGSGTVHKNTRHATNFSKKVVYLSDTGHSFFV